MQEETLAREVGAGLIPVLGAVSSGTAAQVFAAALELGLFRAVGDEPSTPERIRERLDLHPRAVPDFLDALAAMELLIRGENGYRGTAAAQRHLNPDSPEFIGHFLTSGPPGAGGLVDLLRTGKAAGAGAGDPYADPGTARGFIAFMDAMNAMIATELATAIDWSRYGSFVDVDGAAGGLASRLVAAHPHLKGTVVDRAEAESAFRENVAGTPAEDKVAFHAHGGGPLPGADVVLVGGVLHDLSMTERAKLLRRVHEAVSPQGLALVYDIMIDDARTGLDALLWSLQMMLVVPEGGKYREADCRAWVAEAGFTGLTTRSMLSDTLIVARKS